jgi:hypothetical protein
LGGRAAKYSRTCPPAVFAGFFLTFDDGIVISPIRRC